MKIAYTCIFGSGYTLREPTTKTEGWRYICFTDQCLESDVYDIQRVPPGHSRQLDSRRYKILSHVYLPPHRESLYFDARFVPVTDLDRFWLQHVGEGDMAVMRHHRRDTVWEESQHVVEQGLAPKKVVERQMNRYREAGLPTNGLYAPGVMLRRACVSVRDLEREWWSQLLCGSMRDQLSLPYALWRQPVELSLMPFRETYEKFMGRP